MATGPLPISGVSETRLAGPDTGTTGRREPVCRTICLC